MKKTFYASGFCGLLIVTSLTLAMLSINNIIDGAVFIVVIGMSIGLSFLSYGKFYFSVGIKSLLCPYFNVHSFDILAADKILKGMIFHVYTSGIIVFLIGLGQAMQGYENNQMFEASLVKSFVGPLTSILLAEFIFRPALYRLSILPHCLDRQCP